MWTWNWIWTVSWSTKVLMHMDVISLCSWCMYIQDFKITPVKEQTSPLFSPATGKYVGLDEQGQMYGVLLICGTRGAQCAWSFDLFLRSALTDVSYFSSTLVNSYQLVSSWRERMFRPMWKTIYQDFTYNQNYTCSEFYF